MNNLAPELLDVIIELLDRSDLRRCCTVSRRWQFSVERLTFRVIRLKSTNLERFSDIFSDHRRREVLGKLEYDVILPDYIDDPCAEFEGTDKELKDLNNEAFTEAFHGLFRILHSWEHDHGAATPNQKTISLECTVLSLSDQPYIWASSHPLGPCRYEFSFLGLLKDDLPTVSRISCFKLWRYYFRQVEGSALVAIARKLPNLERIRWELNDDDRLFPSLQQQRRYDFAQDLSTLANELPTLKKFRLEFVGAGGSRGTPKQGCTILSSLHPSSPSIDHLSLAIHTLSTRLTCLKLDGPIAISPSIFHGATPADSPFWPNLKYVDIQLSATTATGEWYWEFDIEDPEIGFRIPNYYYAKHQPLRFWRTKVCPETFNPFMLAMARAVPHMPRLRRFSICGCSYNPDSCIEVGYCAAGEKEPTNIWFVETSEAAKWTVPNDLMKAWVEFLGNSGEVKFYDWH